MNVWNVSHRKYLQISLVGASDARFSLSQPKLEAPDLSDVQLTLLNKQNQILVRKSRFSPIMLSQK